MTRGAACDRGEILDEDCVPDQGKRPKGCVFQEGDGKRRCRMVERLDLIRGRKCQEVPVAAGEDARKAANLCI
jgi:hypothetical protein